MSEQTRPFWIFMGEEKNDGICVQEKAIVSELP